MPLTEIHECECGKCQTGEANPETGLHRQMNLLLSRLDEQQRRWYAALESKRIGYGGDRLLAQITGLDEKTIRRGREEMDNSMADRPSERVRVAGGGRPTIEKKIKR